MSLPRWQQDLARRLATESTLTGSERAEVSSNVEAANSGLAPSVEPRAIALDDIPGVATEAAPRLLRFGQLKRVGLVSAEHELEFSADGLTVAYGANAVGKSSYVRGLKRICRTVDLESSVRGNVYAPGESSLSPPTAHVSFSIDGQVTSQEIDLSDRRSVGLDSLSVFDAACAELYVHANNSIAYVPSTLKLLSRMAVEQDQLRELIQLEIRKCESEQPSFDAIGSDTAAGALLRGLDERSTISSIHSLVTITEVNAERMKELQALVSAAASRSVQQDASAAESDSTSAMKLHSRVTELIEELSSSRLSDLQDRKRHLSDAVDAVKVAARVFSGLPVPELGSGAWKDFWRSARNFVEIIGQDFPPGAGSSCPFCLQELSEEVAEQLQVFERHVTHDLQLSAEAMELRFEEARRRYNPVVVQQLRSGFLDRISSTEPTLYSNLIQLLGLIEERYLAVHADGDYQEVQLALVCLTELEDWAKQRRRHATALREASDPAKELELRRELTELEARVQVVDRFDDVEAAIEVRKRISVFRRMMTSLATNKITTKQRELTHQSVSDDLKKSLGAEIEALRVDRLRVDLSASTHVGQTQVGLKLVGVAESVKIGEIASEGERRALALAFFFAELSLADGYGGIILDDPVSSLDDERREHIAARLVAEAIRRQVVVFTHDLPFMLDLVSRYKDETGAEPPIQHVWRTGDLAGRIDDQPPMAAMKLKQRLAYLTRVVESWDKDDKASFNGEWHRICGFYTTLRKAWECAVEEKLFNGVVRRFQREIKTLALSGVVINAELTDRVKEGMGRCSMFAHDQPPASPGSLPDRAQLEADVEGLRAFSKLFS
jgi:ABC-type transport system involved in cytochrome c biogenesis ATPase subunit